MTAQTREPDMDPTPDLLALLDPDPVVAEACFRKLIADLQRSLEWAGCHDPEGVAGESVYRALKKLAKGADTSQSGLRGYVFGIARRVAMEHRRTERREQQAEPGGLDRRPSGYREQDGVEAGLMLEEIRRLLGEEKSGRLLRYCTEEDHTAQCRELNVTPGYLRVMIHRMREELKALALPERAQRGTRRVVRPSESATEE